MAEEELRKNREHLEKLVKARTAELAVAKEQAEAANQAKGELLTRMSHELRTPLHAILGYAQILKRQKDLNPKQLQAVATIEYSAEHLHTLINDILDISRIEASYLELRQAAFELPSFFEVITGIMTIRAKEKGLAFRYESKGPVPHAVYADEVRLKQVLINLLANAVKFTDDGSVSLRVICKHPPSPEYKANKNVCIRFEVADTGVGINAEQSVKIFMPFEQVSDAHHRTEGTGLGLSISQALVQKMGGEIKVDSSPCKGSTFWFDLMLPVVADKESQKLEQRVIGYQGVRRKVLVADDEPVNHTMLNQILETLGFEVIKAVDGREAVDRAQSQHPDLILMDIRMPVMGGYEAVQRIRKIPELNDVVIVGISAGVSEQGRPQGLDDGFDGFMPKPVAFEKLFKVLQELLQVEWIFDEEPAYGMADQILKESVVVPSHEDLKVLHKLAERGNMQRFQDWAARLKANDVQYAPFADKLLEMAGGFRTEAILGLIAHHLGEGDS